MSGTTEFFGALFDFSFTEFITTKLIRIVYGAAIAFWSIAGVAAFLGALASSGIAAVGALILVPIGLLVTVTLTRVWIELIIVAFRIADHVAETAEHAASISINTAKGSISA